MDILLILHVLKNTSLKNDIQWIEMFEKNYRQFILMWQKNRNINSITHGYKSR